MTTTSSTRSTVTTAIPPLAMPLISPPALLQAHLSQTPPIRPSNRSPTQTRPITLNVGSLTHCNGSSVVRCGESTIVCGIRAELLPVSEIPHYRASENARSISSQTPTNDTDDSDDEKAYEAITLNNLLVPNLELSTNSHPSFPANVAPSTTAQSISQRILSLLHTSHLIRVNDLEIRHTSTLTSDLDPDDPGYVEPETNVLKAYWVLYIDCICLSYGGDGNVFDTTVCAIVAALRDVRLPSARWDEDTKQVRCDADITKAQTLNLRGTPTPLSFSVFTPDTKLQSTTTTTTNGSTSTHRSTITTTESTTLLDPDAFEDSICTEKGSIVIDIDPSINRTRILRIEKSGGTGSLNTKAFRDVILHAEKRWKEWKVVLDSAVGGDG